MTYFVDIIPVKPKSRIQSFGEKVICYFLLFCSVCTLGDEDSKLAIESRIQEIM